VALFGLLWIFRQRVGRGCVFAFAYFVLMLFPVLGFFNIYFQRYSLVADHYQYQSIVAVIALVVCFLARLVARPLVRVLLASALIGTLTCLSFRQASYYRDARTLWQDTLAKNPSCWLAHIGFGLTSFGLGRFGEAIEHYQQSLRHGPENAEAHYDLGLAFAQLGRLKEAEFEFAETIRLSPGHVESRNLLGIFCCSKTDHGRLRQRFGQRSISIRTMRRHTTTWAARSRNRPDRGRRRQNSSGHWRWILNRSRPIAT